MELDEILKRAIDKVNEMSIEEFESRCIASGYRPHRKTSCFVNLVEVIEPTNQYQMTYKRLTSLSNPTPSGFGLNSFCTPDLMAA